MYDQANRDIHCLRLSLTESCNLRCCYCRPQEPAALPPQELTDAELLHLVQLFAACGIDTLRLTGGEPLLRAGVPQLTARLKAVPGIRKVTLTTNGTLLSAQLPALKEAGLDGINLSLNSLSYTRNKRIPRCGTYPGSPGYQGSPTGGRDAAGACCGQPPGWLPAAAHPMRRRAAFLPALRLPRWPDRAAGSRRPTAAPGCSGCRKALCRAPG